MKRRAKTQLRKIVALGIVIGTALSVFIATRPTQHTARLVLALSEGSAGQRNTPLPASHLVDYVSTKLLPAAKLTALIESRNLFPLRHKLGPEFALGSLRDLIEINVYRNYFLESFHEGASRSARIELTVRAPDAEFAWRLAQDISAIVTESIGEENDRFATAVHNEADEVLARTRRRLSERQAEASRLGEEASRATQVGNLNLAAALSLEAAAARARVRAATEELGLLSGQAEGDRLRASMSRAGMGIGVRVAAAIRPFSADQDRLRLAMIIAIIILATTIACGVAFAVFDPRVHEGDDATRMGIPVLGQVPSFAGDQLGSLRGRGIRRSHSAWWKRWQ